MSKTVILALLFGAGEAAAMHQKVNHRVGQVDVVGKDDIGTASADDMFAFSQIITAGQNPMAVVAEMEKEQQKKPALPGGLDEDTAVAAFADFMANGGGGVIDAPDPVKIAAKAKQMAAQAQAANELKDLQSNDATAAFAGLVESQVIETKATSYEGSGTITAKQALAEQASPEKAAAPAPEEAARPQKDALLEVQKATEQELTAAQDKVQLTDTATQAAESHLSASELAEIAAAAGPVTPKPAPKPAPVKKAPVKSVSPAGKGKSSKLQAAVEKLHAGYNVKDVNKFIALHKNGAAAKKPKAKPVVKKVAPKAPVAPPKPKYDGAIPDKSEDAESDLAAAQAQQKADAIMSQLQAGGGAGAAGLAGVPGLDAETLQAAVAGMNLVQLDQKINVGDFDPDASQALEILQQQFPEDYPEDHKPAPPPPQPTEAEKEETARKQLIQYAENVAADAKGYISGIQEAEDKAKEDAALEKMGQPGEPVVLQLDSKINLAQTGSVSSSEVETKENLDQEMQESAESAAAEGEGRAGAAEALADKSPEDQAAALQNMNQDELDALTQNLNMIDQQGQAPAAPAPKPSGPKPTKEDYAAADAQMSASGQGQITESLAKAADVVDTETDLDALKAAGNLDAASFDDLKRQAIAAAKAEKAQQVATAPPKKAAPRPAPRKAVAPIVEAIKPLAAPVELPPVTGDAELQEKALAVAHAEAANAAAIDKYQGPSKKVAAASKVSADTSVANAAAQVAAYEAEQQAKAKSKQEQDKYAADKKLALDQGYTEEQADLYARQEALAAADPGAVDTVNQGGPPENAGVNGPANGVNNNPPVQLGNPPATATKLQLGGMRKGGNTMIITDTSKEGAIDKQIKQAQAQQKQMKAALAKKKIPIAKGKKLLAPAKKQVVKAKPIKLAPIVKKPVQRAVPVKRQVAVAPKVIQRPVVQRQPVVVQPVQQVQQPVAVAPKPAPVPVAAPALPQAPPAEAAVQVSKHHSKQELSLMKKRTRQYEKDLNKARDQITIAQKEMQAIDAEVADFHQKMATSMHSLLKAFTEGFAAMDKAKGDELAELKDSDADAEEDDKSMKHFDKLNVGISNLETLTQGLSQSFEEDGTGQQAAPQAPAAAPQQVPAQPQQPALAQPQVPVQAAVVQQLPAQPAAPQQVPVQAVPVAAVAPVAAPQPMAAPVQQVQPVATVAPVMQAAAPAPLTVQPAAQPKLQPAAQANLKAKMQQIMKARQVKPAANLNAQPLKLSQIKISEKSTSEIEELIRKFKPAETLERLRSQFHEIGKSIRSTGIKNSKKQ